MTDQIKSAIAALDEVSAVKAWNDRFYINLEAARGSRANADLRTKIWLKGSVLTIEIGKGYFSDAYWAALRTLKNAVETAGGSVREI